jgi:hypothetical protein
MSTKDIWDMNHIYQSKGPARKAILLKSLMLHNYKYFSYATYLHTKSNQYNTRNAVKEAYGYISPPLNQVIPESHVIKGISLI